MGRFLAFLFTFIVGAVIGVVGGGLTGAAAGGYVGACKVIDSAVEQTIMTQDQANTLVKSIANDLDIKPDQKQRIIDGLKKADAKADAPPSPCSTAIAAL